jgi:hypothetical protein
MTGSAILRRLADLATIPRDWLAFRLIMLWPCQLAPVGMAILPYAGNWAYRADPWVAYCRGHWIRTGEPKPPTGFIPDAAP